LQREAARGVEQSIHGGERLTHQVYTIILRNLQCRKVSKSPMLKILRKVDEDNEGTNQMSVSESENVENADKHKERRETQWHHEKPQIMKVV